MSGGLSERSLGTWATNPWLFDVRSWPVGLFSWRSPARIRSGFRSDPACTIPKSLSQRLHDRGDICLPKARALGGQISISRGFGKRLCDASGAEGLARIREILGHQWHEEIGFVRPFEHALSHGLDQRA